MLLPIEADGLPDDRILCTDCILARSRGEALWCQPFRSQIMPELKRRCVKFVPVPSVADRRTGAQRWPTIMAEIEEVRRMDQARARA